METGLIFSNGSVTCGENTTGIGDMDWVPHKIFSGVYMKTILCGRDTDGRMSCHIVKIDPGHEIGNHVHEGLMELHEIIARTGSCIVGDKVIAYGSGVVAYIPPDVNHMVRATEAGLVLLAKFSPALE